MHYAWIYVCMHILYVVHFYNFDKVMLQGCYSSASSRVSTATIRSTNAKETKEKRNREKLLAGPAGSDISLAPQDMDLEMDYYDYNVVNAGAAPGSYLGTWPIISGIVKMFCLSTSITYRNISPIKKSCLGWFSQFRTLASNWQ